MLDPAAPHLLLDDALFPRVLDGSITASIRIGDRPIEPGRLMFLATKGSYLPLMVTVSSVVKTTLSGIADVHAKRAGVSGTAGVIEMLRGIYPEAKSDTPFTVVLFERVL